MQRTDGWGRAVVWDPGSARMRMRTPKAARLERKSQAEADDTANENGKPQQLNVRDGGWLAWCGLASKGCVTISFSKIIPLLAGMAALSTPPGIAMPVGAARLPHFRRKLRR